MSKEIPECDYGCGRDAHFKDFPQVVNGRLYAGDTCEMCALAKPNEFGDSKFDSTKSAIEALQRPFHEMSVEYEELEEMKSKDFETYK